MIRFSRFLTREPIRPLHRLRGGTVAERTRELLEPWPLERRSRYYDEWDESTGTWAEWPDHPEDARPWSWQIQEDASERLARQGVVARLRIVWSYYDPRYPNLQIQVFPEPGSRFMYPVPPNTISPWHVTLIKNGEEQPITEEQMRHLVQTFDNEVVHLHGHRQGQAFYLYADKGDPIASDPVVQELNNRNVNKEGQVIPIHISM